MLQRGVEEEVQGGSGGGACDDVVFVCDVRLAVLMWSVWSISLVE